jgi:acetyltransferase-like isoleucine patch superfamily enzyme
MRTRLLNPDVKIGLDSRVGAGAIIRCADGGSIRIRNVDIARGVELDAAPGASLDIAADFIGPNCIIAARERITIGDHCQIADNVTIRDHDHVHDASFSLRNREFACAPILIGDNVWIASKATIVAGVTVGDHALIAAGAVVTRDVAAGERVGGVPAKPLDGSAQPQAR